MQAPLRLLQLHFALCAYKQAWQRMKGWVRHFTNTVIYKNRVQERGNHVVEPALQQTETNNTGLLGPLPIRIIEQKFYSDTRADVRVVSVVSSNSQQENK